MYLIKEKGTMPKEVITITDYCNVGNEYRPKVDFNVTYSDIGFHAHFDVYETKPYASYTNHFDPVCCDSCVEWFIYFAPDICDRYFNFEVNANGAMDVCFRKDRNIYLPVSKEDVKTFNIRVDIKDDYWTVDYTIPFDFIKRFIKNYEFKKDVILSSNVYKCGEDTEFEHYGCWGMVNRDAPDFHAPEYFKEMKIV